MKYVVLEINDDGFKREHPFIFPEAWVHATVAEMNARYLNLTKPPGVKRRTVICVSAGFISSMDLSAVEPYGESKSIGARSREAQDRQLLVMMDYSHGIT